MIRQFLLCIVLVAVLCVTGCGGAKGSYFGYREKGFDAVIEGEMDGQTFVAELKSDPVGTSYIYFRSPAALSGLCVEVTRDGTACARLDGLSYVADTETLTGLLRPLTALTESSTDVQRVQKKNGETVLSLPDGTVLVLSEKGIPVRLQSARVRFEVVEWKSTK